MPSPQENLARPFGLSTSRLAIVGVFAIFLFEAVLLQYVAGAYSSDFSSTSSDEAAHFVTALMVRDYLTSQSLLHPWQFAQQYYLHYPKVAIGHWPPGLYAALGIWLLAFGASRTAALFFMATVAALLATVTCMLGVARLGWWAGWFVGIALLALPLAQESTGQVMSEHLASLLMLVSSLQFVRAVGSGRSRDWALFGVIAAAALMTHASCLALAFVPPFFIVLTGRFSLITSRGLWASAAIVLVLCAPWYLASHGIRAEEGAFIGGGLGFVMQAALLFPTLIVTVLGLVLAPLAALGFWTRVIAPRRAGDLDPTWAVLVALLVAKVVLHVVIPAGVAPRYVLAGMPCLLLLAAAGIDRIATELDRHGTRRFLRPALAALALGALAGQGLTVPASTRGEGYALAAGALTASVGGTPQVYLISSDSRGEGSWITGVATGERRPGSIVLRGSKVFAREDWLGRGTVERFESVGDVRALLDRIPVSTVVIDATTEEHERRGYHARLAAAVADSPAWERVADYPLLRFGSQHQSALHAYRRRSNGAQPAAPDMNLIADLILRDGIK
jgi:hypothetical protein